MSQEQPTPAHGPQSVAVTPVLLDAIRCFEGVPAWLPSAIEARTLAGVERYGAGVYLPRAMMRLGVWPMTSPAAVPCRCGSILACPHTKL